MRKKERAQMAVDLLKEEYPDAICSLEYERPYELLISTRLSAQCTDARVNIVTKDLFAKYTSLEMLANADLAELESIIRPCGLYKTKARDIINLSRMLIDEYDSHLPPSLEELTKLPGIGRKTANLIMGDIFHQPAYVCDTTASASPTSWGWPPERPPTPRPASRRLPARSAPPCCWAWR